ncbi:hypothetical protein PR002_g3253, partial [Phytophthora rubi]
AAAVAARCLEHWVVISAERAARHFVDNSALAVAYKRAEDACAAIKGEKELALGDKKTAAVDFKTSLVFGFEAGAAARLDLTRG